MDQFTVPCKVLTVASSSTYRFIMRRVRWSDIPISFKNFPWFVVINTVKGFHVVIETKVNIFLEFTCFLCDPTDVGNFISDSSAFSKPSLYILKSRDITLSTKVRLVKTMVFPVVMYECESWTIKKVNTEELMLLNCGVGEDS